jgi:DNA-binding PadR family transcriptional regulator
MLYPVLHRMESDGLILSEWVVQENGRKRKYYTITAKGKQEREVAKSQWMNVNTALNLLWGESPKIELG